MDSRLIFLPRVATKTGTLCEMRSGCQNSPWRKPESLDDEAKCSIIKKSR